MNETISSEAQPETFIWSRRFSSWIALAAAAIPTVVGAMISSRSGSLSTSAKCLAAGFFRRRRRDGVDQFHVQHTSGRAMIWYEAAIHWFWSAASGDAERIANLPPSSPRIERAMSAITLPVWSKSTWATKMFSPSPEGIGEPDDTTTHAPVDQPLTRDVWSPALVEITTRIEPCVGGVVTMPICPATLFRRSDPCRSAHPD